MELRRLAKALIINSIYITIDKLETLAVLLSSLDVDHWTPMYPSFLQDEEESYDVWLSGQSIIAFTEDQIQLGALTPTTVNVVYSLERPKGMTQLEAIRSLPKLLEAKTKTVKQNE